MNCEQTASNALLLGTGRTPPIFASLRDLCGFALNSSHPVAAESDAIAMSLKRPADLLIMDESSRCAMARNAHRIPGTRGKLNRVRCPYELGT